MQPNCACQSAVCNRFNPLTFLLKCVLLYAALIFGAGTLINTGHPVAVEVGQLIHAVTFVDPAIDWTKRHGLQRVAGVLDTVSDGWPIAQRS